MLNDTSYNYFIMWSPDDSEYVGLCDAFPSLSYLDADGDAALAGIAALAADVIADITATGEPLP